MRNWQAIPELRQPAAALASSLLLIIEFDSPQEVHNDSFATGSSSPKTVPSESLCIQVSSI
jgi:hypothetical protein